MLEQPNVKPLKWSPVSYCMGMYCPLVSWNQDGYPLVINVRNFRNISYVENLWENMIPKKK
jgi:hypothetical protein